MVGAELSVTLSLYLLGGKSMLEGIGNLLLLHLNTKHLFCHKHFPDAEELEMDVSM